MSVIGSNVLAGASGQVSDAALQIDRSLRFNSADSAYLNRTPSSAGNRKTWTWSGWVKKSTSVRGVLFGGGTTQSDTQFTSIEFESDDTLRVTGWNTLWAKSDAVFRDYSAWAHVFISFDSTQSSAGDQIKMYVNGQQLTKATENALSQNGDYGINQTVRHTIGAISEDANPKNDFYLAEINFVDGQALAPTDFGQTDSDNNWNPKTYSGSYGTNGFRLDFSDNSSNAALGTDSSGNSNTWTVNNISTAAGPLSRSRGTNYDDDSATYAEYGTVSQATGQTLPMSNPSHYEGAAMRVNSGGFKVVTTNSATTDFFMACWVKFDSLVNGHQMGVDLQGSYKYFEARSDGRVLVRHTGGGSSESSTGTLSSNTWMHIALSRSGGTLRAFVDGTIVCSTTAGVTGDSISANEEFNFFGQSGTLYNTSGYLLDPVVYIGAGRSTNYTAPTAPLLTSAGAINDVAGMSSSNRYYASPLISVGAGEEAIDSLIDTPTNYEAAVGNAGGNYATMNPLDKDSNCTLSNGNLDVSCSTSGWFGANATMQVIEGKTYFEATYISGSYVNIGLNTPNTGVGDVHADGVHLQNDNGTWRVRNGSSTASISAVSANSVIGVAVDTSANTIQFFVNGSSVYSGTLNALHRVPMVYGYGTYSVKVNFGQRPFAYTPPTGHLSLCTQNLPDPTIADGSTAMDVALYTGNGTSQSITGLGFSPDFVWVKNRAEAVSHFLFDAVRGNNNYLRSDGTFAEDSGSSNQLSFATDGFDVSGTGGGVNKNTISFVGWAWDGGTSTVSNTDGSIASSVRANASAGFSIVSYTGTGAANTIGHGLNVAPSIALIKPTTASGDWYFYTNIIDGSLDALILNVTDPSGDSSWSELLNSSSVLTMEGNSSVINAIDTTYIAYCFAPVEGYSAFGSYTGNGSTDGPFVFTGHKVKWLMVKRTDSSEPWWIWDVPRSTAAPGNPMNALLRANGSDQEYAPDTAVDSLSNGFKPRSSSGNVNASGGTYIYAAFAEHPFKTARAR